MLDLVEEIQRTLVTVLGVKTVTLYMLDKEKNVYAPVAPYGASVKTETPNPRDAYAPFEPPRPVKPSSWEQLPWT